MTVRQIHDASIHIARKLFKFGIILFAVSLVGPTIFPESTHLALAADGSGTNSVSPSSVFVGAVDQTYTFTYTASETMDSGGVNVKIPTSSGFSTPQGTAGTAGYTKVTSSGNARVGLVIHTAESSTGWTEDDSDMCQSQGLDTTNFKAGAGSLYCQIGNAGTATADSGDTIGYDFSAQNWTNYTKVGFWARSDQTSGATGISFFYDNTNTGASPIQEVAIASLSANTWKYFSATLSGTRTSVTTWGIICKTGTNSDCGLGGTAVARINIDEVLLGCADTSSCTTAGSALSFPANGGDTDIAIRIVTMANTETLTITYGSGGGTSGVDVTAAAGSYAATTRSRTSASGTLTAISSSPNLVVDAFTIAGTCKKYDQSTDCDGDDGSDSIKVAYDGTLQGQSDTTVDGSWSVNMGAAPTSGQVITVFIDGAADSREAVAVTKYDGSGTITGIQLMWEHISIGSDDNQTITNANMAVYDNPNDEDIIFDASGTAVDCYGEPFPSGFCSDPGGSSTKERVYIKSGNTLAPGVTSFYTSHMDIRGTFDGSGTTYLTLTGNGTSTTCGNSSQMPLCVNGGTFTAPTSTIYYTDVAADTTVLATNYASLSLTGRSSSSITYILGSGTLSTTTTLGFGNGTNTRIIDGDTNDPAINVATVLTVNANTTWQAGSSIITLSGNGTPFVNSGTFTPGSSTVSFTHTTSASVAATTYNNLDFSPASGTPTYTLLGGTLSVAGNLTLNGAGNETVTGVSNDPTINITGNFTINSGDTFIAPDAGGNVFTVGGSWTNNGTFTHSSGTVTFNGTGTSKTIAPGSSAFNNVTFNGAGSEWSAPAPAWSVAYDTGAGLVYDSFIDSSNGVLYVGTNTGIKRCVLSTGCDSPGEWTDSFTTTGLFRDGITKDTTNNILYAGGGDGKVYRCNITSTSCDANGDWTVSYTSAETIIASVDIDTNNNVLYAGSGFNGFIYRCNITTTSCDASGDWATSYDTASSQISNITTDQTNGILYATGDSAIIYRCNITTTSCDASGDWTVSLSASAGSIYSITIDTTNAVMYAASAGDATYSYIRRCVLSTSCDADGDWTTSLDWGFGFSDVAWDSMNAVLYAVSSSFDQIFVCNISTSCDADGDWTLQVDLTYSNVNGVIADTTNGKLYAGGDSYVLHYTVNPTTITVSGDLTMTAGTLNNDDGVANITVNGGDVTGNGTINLSSGTFTVDGTGNFGGSTSWNFNNLNFGDGSGTTTTTLTGAGTITTAGTLTVAASQTLDVTTNDKPIDANGAVSIAGTFQASDSASFTVAGNFTDTGTFTNNSGTVIFDTTGTSEIDGNSTIFHNFTATTSGKTLKFKQGETVRTNGLLSLANVTLTSISGAAVWIINHQGTESVDTVTISWSDCDASSTTITNTNMTNGGNNDTTGVDCWGLVPPVTVSGVVYANDESSAYGTVVAMKLSLNGGTALSTNSTVTTGAFSFPVPAPTNGDVITIWLDTGGAGGVQGSLVFKYGASCTGHTNCTGLKVVRDQVRLENFHTGNLVTTDFATCDNDSGTGCSDTDIGFTANSGVMTTTWATNELKIATGDTYAPGGNVNVGKLEVAGTYTGASETLTLSGSGTNTSCDNSAAMPLCVGGTFTAPTTTTFTGTSASTIYTGATYNALNFTPAGTVTYTLNSGTLRTDSTFTIGNGSNAVTVDADANDPNFDVRGNFTLAASALFTKGSGVMTFKKGSTGQTLTTSSLPNLGEVRVSSNGGATTLNASGDGFKATKLTIDSGQTLDASGATYVYVTGAGTGASRPFYNNGGTFTGGNTNFYYSASTGAVDVEDSATYGYLFLITDNNASYTLATTSSRTITATGLNIGDGNVAVAVSGATNNPNITVEQLTVGNLATFTTGSGTITLSGSGTPLTKGGTATFTASTGNTVAYTSSSGVTALASSAMTGSNAFYNLTINSSGDTFTAGVALEAKNELTVTGGTLAMGANNLTVGNSSVSNSGSIKVASGQSLTQSSAATTTMLSSASGNNCIGSNGASCTGTAGTISLYNFTIGNGSTSFTTTVGGTTTITIGNDFSVTANAAFSGGTSMAVTGNLSNSGTLTSATTLTVSGNFTDSGTFNHNSGTVVFNGAGTSQIDGNSTIFNNFTSTTAGKAIRFKQSETVRINGLLTLTGSSGSPVTLDSIDGSTQWTINHQGTEAITYTTATRGACDGSSTQISMGLGTASGGSLGACWNFIYRTISNAGGNYNSAATWVEGIVPTSSDPVVATATSGPLTVNVSSAAASIDFTNYTNTLTMNADLSVAGSVTLVAAMTISGSSALTVYATGTITSNGKTWPNALNLGVTPGSAAATYTISGDLTVTGSLTITAGRDVGGGGFSSFTQTINGSNIYVGGSLTVSAGGDGGGNITGTSDIILNGTGTWSNTGTTAFLSNDLSINTAGTITISGTVVYNSGTFTYTTGTVVSTGSTLASSTTTTLPGGITLNNLSLGSSTGAEATYTLAGNLTLTGTLSVNAGRGGGGGTANGATQTINGNTLYAASLYVSTNSDNGTGTINGTTAIVLEGTGTWTQSANPTLTNNVTIDTDGITTVSGTVGYSGTLTNNGSLTNNGTFNISTIGGSGNLINGAAGTLNISSASAPTITTLTATASGNIVNYTAADPNCKVTTYHHLNFTGSGTVTCAVTTVNGNLGSSGTVSWTTGANLTVGGTLTVGAGTTFITGSNFTLGVTSTTSVTGNLRNSNSGTKTYTGLVTVNSGGSFESAGNGAMTFTSGLTIASGGSYSNAGNANVSFGGPVTNNAAGTLTIGTGTGTVTASTSLAGTGAITFGGAVTINNDITLTNNNSGIVTFSSSITGGNSSSNFATSSGSTTKFAGSVMGTGTLTPSASAHTIEYTGAGQTIKAPTTNPYYHLILSGSGTASMASGLTAVAGNLSLTGTVNATTGDNLVVSGNVSVGTGTTLTLGAFTFGTTGTFETVGTGTFTATNGGATTLTGNVTNAGTFTAPASLTLRGNFTNNGAFTHNNGTVVISPTGSSATLNGSTGTTTFYNLTVSNQNGKYLYFKDGNTYSVEGLATLSGSPSDGYLYIGSVSSGQTWTFNFAGTSSLSYIWVQDSVCSGNTPTSTLVLNGGNNSGCWSFINRGGSGSASGDGGSGGGSGQSGGGGGGGGGGGSVQATATAEVSGGAVTTVNITNGGNGYPDAPLVCFSGGGGSGAIAISSVSGSIVISITVTNGGSNYASPPTVSIGAPGTSGGSCGGGQGGGGGGGGGGGSP